MKWSTSVMIGLVLAVAGVRLFQLGSLPSILNRDEAALAYNARLLKETGMDEWGRQWPLTLESFGDYKLPGYSWWLVGLFTLFGYHDWVVRLPAVVAGVWLVLVVWWIARAWKWPVSDQLLGVVLVGFSPIFIFYSRMAWEATVGLAWALTGFYCLWVQASTGKKQFLFQIVGIAAWMMALLTYNIPFVILPLLLPTLILRYGWRNFQSWLFPFLGLLILFITVAVSLIPLTGQKSSITVFSDPTMYAEWISYRSELTGLSQRILGNRYLFFAQEIAQRALQSFSPTFLVLKGGSHPWHQVPGTGHLFWSVYLLGLGGLLTQIWELFELGRRRQWSVMTSSQSFLLIVTCLLGLLPASITVDAPHATRSLFFFFFFCLLAVRGWRWLVERVSRTVAPDRIRLLWLGMYLVILLETIWYGYQYFGRYPGDQNALRPGYQAALHQIDRQYPGEKVAIVDPNGYDYILVAWYGSIQPNEYFSTIIRQQPDRIGFRYGQQLAEYHFVAQAADREADERVILEWQVDHWQIKYQP